MNMRNLTRSALLFLALLIAGIGGPAAAKEPPVLMLMKPQGTVEYSKNGTKWKKVRRNKFLFSGYQVRTSGDGSGTLIHQESGMSRTLGADSVIKITASDAELVSGKLSDPVEADPSLKSGLKNRFSKAQRYTTVRRSVNKKQKLKLSTIRQVTLSDTYPELVWQNPGADFSFSLSIDDKKVMDIAPTSEDMVRVKIPALSPGDHTYRVDVLKGGEVAFQPRREGTIRWLSTDEEKSLTSSTKTVEEATQGDKFLVAAHLEAQGLTVPAMDLYRQHFSDYPDDNDMRPILIKAYHDLKLSNLKKKEAILYNTLMAEE